MVNCSFQGGRGDAIRPGLPTEEVFRLLARQVGWAVYDTGIDVPVPGQERSPEQKPSKANTAKALTRAFANAENAFEVFEIYLQDVIDRIRPRRLLLMLDEFDKIQEGIESGVTSPIVPENLRYLIHTYSNLAVILSGSRRLKRLREEYWSALFGLGHRIEVGPLPREDARLLVTSPVEGRLSFVPLARDLIVDQCARQPFLIQSLCNHLFERASRTGERIVTQEGVREATEDIVRDNEHLRTVWEYAATDRRRLIVYLAARLADGPDPVTLSTLETELEERGIPAIDEEIEADLEILRELEILEMHPTERGHVYLLSVPLMESWIKQHVDFDELVRKAVREAGG